MSAMNAALDVGWHVSKGLLAVPVEPVCLFVSHNLNLEPCLDLGIRGSYCGGAKGSASSSLSSPSCGLVAGRLLGSLDGPGGAGVGGVG